MKEKIVVVKVQASLNIRGMVLIYTKDQKFIQDAPALDIWEQVMTAWQQGIISYPKMYCKAVMTKYQIDLRGPSEDQNPGW